MIRKVFTNILILVLVTKSYSFDFLGPVHIEVKRLEKCGEDMLGVNFNYLRHRINRTAFGNSVNLTLPFDLDDTISMNVSASIWGDGGWKPNAFDFHTEDLCTFLLTKFRFYSYPILDLLGLPHECPIPAGFYSTSDFVYNGEAMYPFLYGEFRLDVNLIKDNVVFLCLRQIIVTTPKE